MDPAPCLSSSAPTWARTRVAPTERSRLYDVTEAQLLLRWGVQKGYPVLPKSTNPARMRENADLFSFAIDEADMAEIATMNSGGGVAWPVGDPTRAA